MSKGSLGQLNKRKIRMILAAHYKEHVSLTDIIQEFKPPLAKSKIIDHLNDMRKTGEVAKENGHRGKYYLTSLDASTAAYLLGFYSMSIFDQSKHDRIDEYLHSFLSKTGSIDVTQRDHMALKLFKLSNKIGALIVYFIILGLDPENKFIRKTLNEYSDAKLDEDLVIQGWIEDCVHWGLLMLKTRDYIKQNMTQTKKKQVLFLDRQTIKLAAESYSKVYPDIYRTIGYIVRSLLPK